MNDVNKIRKDFPILDIEVYGKPLVYFDNAATTQKPLRVIRKMEEVYSKINANIHRGVHHLSRMATESHEQARNTVCDYINARHSREIIFTRGTTDAINLLASSFCRSQCNKDDEIILTEMEHHANIVPWQLQKEITGIKPVFLPVNNKGEISISNLKKLITNKTKLVSITHVSNVLGTVNPIEEIVNIAHKYNIPVMIDAAQSIQHQEIDVQAINCDFLVFSSHKMYGPLGVGVLYGKESWLDKLPPYQGGGEMISQVGLKHTVFNSIPFKFEAGTPDYAGTAGLKEAIDYIKSIGLDKIQAYEEDLFRFATNELLKIRDVKIIGNAENKSSVISFIVKGIHNYDVGMLLDQMGFALRTGHHCAQPLINKLNIEGTLRASFAFYNTKEEIIRFIEALERAIRMLK
ncbi:MAG: SufS family cysteine desulfurase [Dysgonamonadaceae bacterium]|jgi:cysteine desulfurase/selenocysteine lyase|nr:SufS family cysteine desulfurase [Dysgonamonadaceae bacterium]